MVCIKPSKMIGVRALQWGPRVGSNAPWPWLFCLDLKVPWRSRILGREKPLLLHVA